MLNVYNAFVIKGMSADWCWDNYLNFRALKQTSVLKRASDVRVHFCRATLQYSHVEEIEQEVAGETNVTDALAEPYVVGACQLIPAHVASHDVDARA